MTPYITAKLEGSAIGGDLVIGDGREIGMYVNKKLSPEIIYKAFLRAVIKVRLERNCSLPLSANMND